MGGMLLRSAEGAAAGGDGGLVGGVVVVGAVVGAGLRWSPDVIEFRCRGREKLGTILGGVSFARVPV